MKIIFRLLLAVVLLSTVSCNKNTPKGKISYNYRFNKWYSGSYPSHYYVAATLIATEKKDAIEFEVHLSGLQPNDSFSVHIHQKDLTQPFGYSGNPVIDLGTFKEGNQMITKEISAMDFDTFTNSFEGYFIVHDPANIQNDTTTLLIYGRTGKLK